MMHSGPKPLKVALELTRRLQTDLARQLTSDQRRDLVRIEKLIEEAERNHVIEVTRLHSKAMVGAPPLASPTPAPPKKRFWM